ncbi:GATA transcription factor LreB [Aspergillus mulundensis]|uniref:Uncharacterized protein n=1 Tax=Aspergillus mulundensis TaxID=1810919 RepID=A0A3D8T6K4_9EURO|nr:Uncharacterized protein DSM5745_01505 [Aspergillus mulundensis]RDW94183.1 Uncharacterized protein DSM5745_01505 [Aspergillus mulundensis]
MDPSHLHLAQPSHQYALDPELTATSYTTPIGVPQLQHSLLQSQPSINPSATGTDELPWPQRVLSEVRDLLLLLSPDGLVNYISPSCKEIMGFETPHFENDYLSRFIHDDDKPVFTRELRDSVSTGRPFHCHFRMYQFDNSTCLFEANGHPHFGPGNNNDATGANQQQQQQFCNGVFLVCRPYLTPSKHLIDSFLEHKLENIRLRERIAQLKREEESDLAAAAQHSRLNLAPRPTSQASRSFTSNLDPSLLSVGPGAAGDGNESSDTMDNANELDIRRSGSGASGGQVEEAPPHLNDVELLTGLYLREGERSQGISTGLRENRLYNQLAGANASNTTANTNTNANPPSIMEQRVPPESEPRKRLRAEYKCADCGTSDSPEWRKGPEGPKTLCNACGLRWAKMEKRRQDTG